MFAGLELAECILGAMLLASSLGVIAAQKPVHSSLFFMATLIILAFLYLHLSADFIAVMQVLVYAGAILVLFVFVIVLFQDAHQHIALYEAKTARWLVITAAIVTGSVLLFLSIQLEKISIPKNVRAEDFGQVESLGRTLYLDFFFPFEAVVAIFLIAIVGALYVGKKVK